MIKHYRNYFWKEAIPYGFQMVTENAELSYKIVMDPYRKRISIEKYLQGKFTDLIYDSALLDFRHLKPAQQLAWHKTIVEEAPTKVISAIRNQDDRLVLLETYTFDGRFCKQCMARSPHGICISRQQIYYTALNDSFNGVVLYDSNDHPVMFKRYACDVATGDFTNLLEEQWDMSKHPLPVEIAHA